MNRPAAGVADLVHAMHALQPNAAATTAIVRMCGLQLMPELEALDEPILDDGDETTTITDDEVTSLQSPDQSLPPTALRLKPVRQSTPPLSTTGDPLATPRGKIQSTRAQFEGLFEPRDAAALVRLAVSVLMSTDKIDAKRVARDLAEAKPLTSLPYLLAPSLSFGAQVLIDIGLPMQPFADDQEALLERVRRTLRELAEIRYFADDPTTGVGPKRRRVGWTSYTLPLPGTPVLALTDMGCGFPRRQRAMGVWARLAEQLRRRQNRLVVFAPVRRIRIPLELRHAAEIAFWDRTAGRRNITQLSAGVHE